MMYADIELINADDLVFARKHMISEEEIKRMRINVLVNTGSCMLTINESIQV